LFSNFLFSQAFFLKSRLTEKAFSRTGILSFPRLIACASSATRRPSGKDHACSGASRRGYRVVIMVTNYAAEEWRWRRLLRGCERLRCAYCFNL
jgi:hypothetical protein